MLDPQNIQLVVLLAALAFFLTLILCLFYGLFLLGRIRAQAVRINKRLDELLARKASGPPDARDAGFSL